MTEKRQYKQRLYTLFAAVSQALANPHRLELIDLLAQAPRTVEDLAREADMSLANTSQHLQRLKQARLVETQRDGTFIIYRLANPTVSDLWLALRSVAGQQLAEVEQALDAYRTRRHEFKQITVQELQERLQTGEVILIDVRPATEYRNGHLPGALSMPLSEIQQMMAALPDDRMVVAYCRGPYCVMADQALEILAENGRKVARLEEGVVEWQQAGYPVSYH
ncbi:MAG: metalloregulator ArsR/SmtB family transcription factor [Chloroflexi bacterium]|nr:metalloregulator ArsR/SmtB family transcription factor [Chloroflexota bacterium]